MKISEDVLRMPDESGAKWMTATVGNNPFSTTLRDLEHQLASDSKAPAVALRQFAIAPVVLQSPFAPVQGSAVLEQRVGLIPPTVQSSPDMESMHGVPTRIQSFNDHTGEIAPFKTVLVRTEESARTQAEAPSYSPRLDSDELQAPVGRVDEALESEPFVSRENVLVQPDDAAVLNVLQGEGGARLVARINGASQMEIAKIVHAINLDLTADGRGLLDATVNGHDVVLNLDRTGTN